MSTKQQASPEGAENAAEAVEEPLIAEPEVATPVTDEAADEATAAEPAPAVARADEVMDRAGERVGQFLRSGERAAQFLRSGGEQLRQIRSQAAESVATDEESAAEAATAAEAPPEAVARAEALMDRAGERVGQFLRFGGEQVNRTTARAREAVEDFVAEAESIRRGERASPD